MSLKQRIGLLRSYLIYYLKPFNKRRLMGFYRQFIQPGDLCFDIGAHMGNRSNAWLALGARVVAIEPQPQCVRFLQRSFSQNEHFTLLEKAAGSEPGTARLQISSLTPTISTLAGEDWKESVYEKSSFPVYWDEEIEVPVITLDQLIEEFGMPAFCKVDVEDFEAEVLRGLSRPIPCLSLEYFTPTIDRALECMDLLKDLGDYEYNWSYGESQTLNAEQWLSYDDMYRILSGYTPEDRSGDIYARLRS